MTKINNTDTNNRHKNSFYTIIIFTLYQHWYRISRWMDGWLGFNGILSFKCREMVTKTENVML